MPVIAGTNPILKDIGSTYTLNVEIANAANRYFAYSVRDFDVVTATPPPNYGDDYWSVAPSPSLYYPNTGGPSNIMVQKNQKYVAIYELTSTAEGSKIIGYTEFVIADLPISPL
ncbi:hypothetical protein [Cohnella faecalis]|uniref:Uncharacterized protein n=1 Tax=Cohnella faecalis TaxID=2315694 RepID=A0A398CT59_9BACL|nr:hypothetical protein [Cohnella faecalis]RIE02501.1 hypothetical protein D3H35_17575 [Cohnella faecalis]